MSVHAYMYVFLSLAALSFDFKCGYKEKDERAGGGSDRRENILQQQTVRPR